MEIASYFYNIIYTIPSIFSRSDDFSEKIESDYILVEDTTKDITSSVERSSKSSDKLGSLDNYAKYIVEEVLEHQENLVSKKNVAINDYTNKEKHKKKHKKRDIK